MSNEKIYGMSFSKIYPLLVSKAQKKGRTLEEVTQIITWLTGYTAEEIEKAAAGSVTYGDFFRNAPQLNPNRKLITGVICGVRVETIEEPLNITDKTISGRKNSISCGRDKRFPC